MFLNVIKRFFAKRILRNQQTLKVSSIAYPKTKTIGILINVDEVESIEPIILQLKLNFTNFHFDILVYTENKSMLEGPKLSTFSFKNLNLFAQFNSVELKEFVNKDFDILINYYKNTSLPLALVAHQSKAKTQVGFANELNNKMVLTIDTDLSKPQEFFRTLHQYLTLTQLI